MRSARNARIYAANPTTLADRVKNGHFYMNLAFSTPAVVYLGSIPQFLVVHVKIMFKEDEAQNTCFSF